MPGVVIRSTGRVGGMTVQKRIGSNWDEPPGGGGEGIPYNGLYGKLKVRPKEVTNFKAGDIYIYIDPEVKYRRGLGKLI